MIDLTEGDGKKSSLGAFALRYSFLLPFSFLSIFLSFNPVSLCNLGFYMFA